MKISVDQITEYASRYPVGAEKDDEAIRVATLGRVSGYLQKDQLLVLARWKTPRILPLIRRNTPFSVFSITSDVFIEAENDYILEAVQLLTSLSGVGLPMATSILHLAGFECPIIDYRALWTLGIPHSNTSWAGLNALFSATKELVAETGVTYRELDRGLWQYSRENQPAGSSG